MNRKNPYERHTVRGENYKVFYGSSLSFSEAEGTCTGNAAGVTLGFRTFRGFRETARTQ
jgi:hypothetical protein